jgi:hypothetical protein
VNRKLKNALRQQKQKTKQEVPQITGTLGIQLGGSRLVEVPNRNSYVYVRLRNSESEVIQAFNNQVASSYNLPVIVERQGNRYVVVAVDSQRYENNHPSVSPYLPRHGNTHSFDLESGGGGDIVWVQSRQMMPMLVLPSGTAGADGVVIASYTLRKENGNWIYAGNTGTQSFAPYVPSSPTGAIMGLVYLDASTGNPQILINSGTVFSASLTGTSQIVSYIPQVSSPSTQIPLAAVRLVTGTTTLLWDNIYDVRQWLHTVPTGTSGGGGTTIIVTGTSAQDEGIPLGTVGTFNFVGSGVDVTVSGTVARVHITGSTGGGIANLTGTSVGLPDSPVMTNSSGYLTTQPQLKWGLSSNKLFYEFGANETKESNAGKIGYELFSSGYMEGVGAGTSSPNRWWRFYDNVKVNSHLQSSSIQNLGLLNAWVYHNETGTEVGPINAPQLTSITGTDYVLGIKGADSSSVKVLATHLAEGIVYTDVIATFLDNTQVSATGTFFSAPYKPTANTTQNQFPWPEGGLITNLVFRKTNVIQPASGSLVITLMVNAVATALTATVPAGSATNTFEDTTHEVSISAGDVLMWRFQNNATSNSAIMVSVAMKLNKRATA